jgi:predicted RNA binding protein YcfA (HicA-like mRNA interferase family)
LDSPFQFLLALRAPQDATFNPVPWERLVCVFEQLGYHRAGQKGSHIKLEKPGSARPLIIPRYDEVGLDIVNNLMRTAGIKREAFFALLRNCR